MITDQKLKDLAHLAGFIVWADTHPKSSIETIDWSCGNYDEEFTEFSKLIVKECVKILEENHNQKSIPDLISKIKNQFNVD